MAQTLELNELKEQFLQKGGILLRKGTSKAGEPTILHRKRGMVKYATRLTYGNEKLRNEAFDYLTRRKNEFFKSDEL